MFILCLSVWIWPTCAQQVVRPNVVLIMVDDLGYGDLGCYGSQRILTPRIDAMAAAGMRFTQFYSGTSVCAPSRAALLTGLHTGHTAVRGNREVKPEGQYPLPDSSVTMAEVFRQAGYATGGFGKWGLGFPGSTGDPMRQGFSRFFGYNCQREAHHPFPAHLWSDTQRVPLPNTYDRQTVYAPDLIHRKALEFLDANARSPFFLYIAYTPPHAALQVPAGDSAYAAYRELFRESPVAIPEWKGVGYQPNPYPKAAYAAMVSRIDRYVGELLDRLRQLGIEDRTLVLFTSDNGPHREGGHDPDFFAAGGGLRGIKRSLYEGGIRAPLVACWPGVIRPGAVSDHVSAAWDLLPTFASLLRVGLPLSTDGITILPLLTGRGRQRGHRFLYWEFHEEEGRQAVRMGRWKGIRQRVTKDPDGPVELYDLFTDPAESRDVAAAHPEVVRRIRVIMEQQHREHSDFPLTER